MTETARRLILAHDFDVGVLGVSPVVYAGPLPDPETQKSGESCQ
ncbi:hypothetical protein [Actinomadura kijaniata]|nr:hypothetical protein [Actinomadura kijaniata]